MRSIKMVAAFVALVSVAVLAGCNTTEGFGKDMERGGEKLQHEAREHR